MRTSPASQENGWLHLKEILSFLKKTFQSQPAGVMQQKMDWLKTSPFTNLHILWFANEEDS
jgi:hypothetical protein